MQPFACPKCRDTGTRILASADHLTADQLAVLLVPCKRCVAARLRQDPRGMDPDRWPARLAIDDGMRMPSILPSFRPAPLPPMNYLKLTPRWKPMRPHAVQAQLYHSPARFKMVVAGRRSGKTETAKRMLVERLWDCLVHPRPWPDPRFFAAAPTRDQAKKIWWQDLKALVPPAWMAGKPSESELCIRTIWGAELWVVGLNVPQRIEGVSWDGGVADEFADCPCGLFDANVRPALADRAGWMWFIGVPDKDAKGQVWYEEQVTRARSGVDPEWEAFTWPSADILPPAEVESARRVMDPRVFRQEYLGEFILSGGRAFPDFEHLQQYPDGTGPDGRPRMRPGRHVRPCPYDPALPLCWSLDFNIADGSPACSGVLQYDGKGHVRVIHEFAIDGVSTNVVADAFLAEAETRKWNLSGLRVYGDATGNARDSTSGTSGWYILRNRLKNVGGAGGRVAFLVPNQPPSIKDTVNAVNARVMTADGTVRLSIDPSCKRIIDDMRSALWPSDMEPQHAVSWMRYFCESQFPVMVERGSRPTVAVPGQAGRRA